LVSFSYKKLLMFVNTENTCQIRKQSAVSNKVFNVHSALTAMIFVVWADIKHAESMEA